MSLFERHPTLAFYVRTTLVVVGVVILERITSRLVSLPEGRTR